MAAAAAVTLAGHSVCPASDPPPRFAVRAAADVVRPTSATTVAQGEYEMAAGVGPELSFEWRFGDLVGVEAGWSSTRHDLNRDGASFGSVDRTAATVNVNFHLLRTGRIDLYLGPSVGWLDWGDVEVRDGDDLPAGGGASIGYNVGADVTMTRNAALNFGLRYVVEELETDGNAAGLAVNVNPLVLRGGLTFRY